MVRVTELSAVQAAVLRSTQTEILSRIASPNSHHAETAAALKRLYKRVGLTLPKIMWVDSPMVMRDQMRVRRYNTNLIDNLRRDLDPIYNLQVGESLRTQLMQALRLGFERVLPDPVMLYAFIYAFARDELKVQFTDDYSRALDDWLTILDGCWNLVAFDDVIICAERPRVLHVEVDRRLSAQLTHGARMWHMHCIDGPAIQFRDGTGQYVVHGTTIDRAWIDRRHAFTAREWYYQGEPANRRILAELIGYEKLVRSEEPKVSRRVSTDNWGTLWSINHPNDDDEPLMLVEVLNSTPEPDGSVRTFFLRVDPRLRPMKPDGTRGDGQSLTPLNAIASTFGMTGDEYVHVKVQT